MVLYDWILKIQNLMQIVQMSPRLDRLSALLEGVAPVFSVWAPPAPADRWAAPDPCTEPSLAMVIPAAGANPQSPAHTSPQPLLWIGHLSHWIRTAADRDTAASAPICIRAHLTGPLAPLLMEEFTAPASLATGATEPALHAPVSLIQQEVLHPRCGQPALLKSAGDILFIGVLRHLVAHPKPERPGLLQALSDARIAKALVALHQNPQLDWDLFALAQEAGMSRTSFATCFKKTMNKTPGKYLVAMRLALARRALANGKTVKEAARISGYRSPASIARAMKTNLAQHLE